ncbi:maleate cis-trans isomerase family protein [Pelagibius sp.]|uniref:maleate cis-trans isomerase family protein n=1 Tax=Pelagibius sp. TaxID=1931238 RepID=UPI003BB03D3A
MRLHTLRVGLVLPSINTLTEPEFYSAVASGLTFHSTRVFMAETTREDLEAMNRQVANACRLLSSTTPDIVVYACTSGTFVSGREELNKLINKMGNITGCPIVATSEAMLEAFSFMNAKEVALVTPYPDEITRDESSFIQDQGYEVVFADGLGRSGKHVRASPGVEVDALVKKAAKTSADLIFVSCTDLEAFHRVQDWEGEYGKTVLTSNQVTLWAATNKLGTLSTPSKANIELAGWVRAQSLFAQPPKKRFKEGSNE